MIPFDELNQQNHEITELCKVLSVLIQDRSMCDTGITCELFERFSTKVKDHLDLEDRTLYSKLLAHEEKSINQQALRSLNGSKEIKRLFNGYMSRWCRKGLCVFNHETFVKETDDMFRLLLDRIQTEVEQLYPLVRELESRPMARSA